MYDSYEEDMIYKGVNDILFNLERLPVDDVADLLVKYAPELSEKLSSCLIASLIAKEITKEMKNVEH